MITTEGEVYLKRYLAGWVPRIASSIAFGASGKAEAVADTKLSFEIGRADVMLTSYDFVADKLIFKAALPDDFEGVIYEVGLFSEDTNSLAGEYGSRMLSTFDDVTESWYNPVTGAEPTYVMGDLSRIGPNSLRLTTPAAGGTARVMLDNFLLDFSGNTSGDKFILAWNNGANVANIKVLFKTDDANYYTVTFAGGTGYTVATATMAGAVSTGSPDWSEINFMEAVLTATAAGAATAELDGLRIEDLDSPNPEYVMISREVLTTPFRKEAGRIQAVEFSLNVSI